MVTGVLAYSCGTAVRGTPGITVTLGAGSVIVVAIVAMEPTENLEENGRVGGEVGVEVCGIGLSGTVPQSNTGLVAPFNSCIISNSTRENVPLFKYNATETQLKYC